MSTYYEAVLFSKGEVIAKNIDANFIKNCLSGWNIEGDEVYNVSEEILNKAKNASSFVSTKHLGRIRKENLPTVDSDFVFEIKEHERDSEEIVLTGTSKETVEYIKSLKEKFEDFSNNEMKEYMSMTDEQKKEYNSKFYNISYAYIVYHRGQFFNANSFDAVIEDCEKNLKEIEKNKTEWDKIRTSIEYLKLSQEEKDNVFSSYEYKIEDEDGYYKWRLDSALKIRHLCEVFEDALLFIYPDTAEYNEFPEDF